MKESWVMKRAFGLGALLAISGLAQVLIVQPVLAESLTVDGETFNDITWGKATISTVTIHHKAGVATIPLEKLPADLQRRFGYDRNKIIEDQARQQGESEQKNASALRTVVERGNFAAARQFLGSQFPLPQKEQLEPKLRRWLEQADSLQTARATVETAKKPLMDERARVDEARKPKYRTTYTEEADERRCPLCQGTGVVRTTAFSNFPSPRATPISATCNACNGTGILSRRVRVPHDQELPQQEVSLDRLHGVDDDLRKQEAIVRKTEKEEAASRLVLLNSLPGPLLTTLPETQSTALIQTPTTTRTEISEPQKTLDALKQPQDLKAAGNRSTVYGKIMDVRDDGLLIQPEPVVPGMFLPNQHLKGWALLKGYPEFQRLQPGMHVGGEAAATGEKFNYVYSHPQLEPRNLTVLTFEYVGPLPRK